MLARRDILFQERHDFLAQRVINSQRDALGFKQIKPNRRGGIEGVGKILMQLIARNILRVLVNICGREQLLDEVVDRRRIHARLLVANNPVLIDYDGPIRHHAIGITGDARGATQRVRDAGHILERGQLRGVAVIIIQTKGNEILRFVGLIDLTFRGWTSRAARASIMPEEKQINHFAAVIGQFDFAVF